MRLAYCRMPAAGVSAMLALPPAMLWSAALAAAAVPFAASPAAGSALLAIATVSSPADNDVAAGPLDASPGEAAAPAVACWEARKIAACMDQR